MTADPTSAPQPPLWLAATAEDFAVTDVDGPLTNARTIDCNEVSGLYHAAVAVEAERRNGASERAYAMLAAVCSFYFKPNEPNEPFGPMLQTAKGRSPQPSDFKDQPAAILATQIERISNLGVRARLADLVWLIDRKQAAAGVAAVNGYADIIQAIINRTANSAPHRR